MPPHLADPAVAAPVSTNDANIGKSPSSCWPSEIQPKAIHAQMSLPFSSYLFAGREERGGIYHARYQPEQATANDSAIPLVSLAPSHPAVQPTYITINQVHSQFISSIDPRAAATRRWTTATAAPFSEAGSWAPSPGHPRHPHRRQRGRPAGSGRTAK